MAENKDGAELTEEPSQKKLGDARAKGDVVRSHDLLTFASFAGAFSALAMMGNGLAINLVNALTPFLAHAGDLTISGADGQHFAVQIAWAALPMIVAVTLGAALCGVGAGFLQQGLIFSPSKLLPDFNRISPMAGLSRVFGMEGISNFGITLLKALGAGLVAWWVLAPHVTEFANLAWLSPVGLMAFMTDLLKRLLMGAIALAGLLGAVDYVWQRQKFMSRMRMTKEDVKEELKQSDGDPHIKAKHKQIRFERARRRMMQAVPKATVVVTNPTHYAVALLYEAGQTGAPQCVAKGMDELALKIRSVAQEAGVPIVEDPPLARALYATVEIDQQIPQQHFEAVAKIVGFVLNAAKRQKVRARPL